MPATADPRVRSRHAVRRPVQALLLAAMCLVGCGRSASPSPKGEVLLILTIDTLRADRIGCGGDPRARTPHLDRAARRGEQFACAVSAAPLTLPAHASILSGRVPPDHGARDNGLYRVGDDVPLLSESFAAAGWRTAAFVAAYPLARRFGLARGFDVYHDAPGLRAEGSASAFVERPADRVNADLFAWLDAERPADRLFLWVHYFDAHAPYEPPAPYARLASGDPYRGEIAFVDQQAGRLFRRLETVFARTRVAWTADHGESLGEHGEETHGIFVYESTTRVPLALAGEGVRPGRIVAVPASLTGLAATVTKWAGVHPDAAFDPPLPTGDTPGDEAAPIYVESMYPRLRHGWASLRGFRSGTWKVIRAPIPEVYDLAADPGELTNLAGSPDLPPQTGELLASLAKPRWQDRMPDRGAIDPEVEEALRSLGYASVAPRSPDVGEGPDPKDRVRLERLLGEATGLLEAGHLGAARAVLAQALDVEPRNKETNVILARIEAASGNDARAKELLAWCLTLPPASADPVVHYAAGKVALDAGRWADAEESFLRCATGDPLHVDAWYNAGVAAYRQERWAAAAAHWREVLRLDPDHPGVAKWLADVERRIASTGSP